MDLNEVRRSKLSTCRSGLEACTNAVVVGKNYETMTDTDIIAGFSPLTPDYEQTFQVHIMDT